MFACVRLGVHNTAWTWDGLPALRVEYRAMPVSCQGLAGLVPWTIIGGNAMTQVLSAPPRWTCLGAIACGGALSIASRWTEPRTHRYGDSMKTISR
jgi:hypothetical protein